MHAGPRKAQTRVPLPGEGLAHREVAGLVQAAGQPAKQQRAEKECSLEERPEENPYTQPQQEGRKGERSTFRAQGAKRTGRPPGADRKCKSKEVREAEETPAPASATSRIRSTCKICVSTKKHEDHVLFYVSSSVYIYIYVCIYIYMYMPIHICMYEYIFIYCLKCTSIYLYIYVSTYLYTYMHFFVYISTYLYIYISTYLYI